MFIAVKNSKILSIHELEWECRRKAKGLSDEDYEIHQVDVDVAGLTASGYIHSEVGTGKHYHLKWDGSKIIKDDEALTAYQTAEKWKRIRIDRNVRLAETDYLALKDNTLSADMKAYRKALRDVPKQTDPDNITWPIKPE